MTTPFDRNVTSRGDRNQPGASQATPALESVGDQDQLASLQLRVAIAEATARLVAAEQATALGRRTTAEHLLAAQELEDTISRRSRSRSLTPPSSPAGQPPSPTPVFTSDTARLVQYFEDREARTQLAAEQREARMEQAAAEREALRAETQHAAQLAALLVSPLAGGHPGSFTPNKGFNDIKLFSWARGQNLLPWLQQLRSRANFLKTPADDAARELCLKLAGDALLAYNQRFPPDSNPTFEEVAAQLAKAFIKPYQGAARWSAYFRFKRPAGSSGKEVKQQLHNARQACLDDGIPVDDLSPAEHLFYIYQLSLSTAQSAQFLASLSSNPLASDYHLRTLTPPGETDRRASAAGLMGSEARTALFQLRVALVEAFLDHDNGDGGHGGGARAAVTTCSPDGPAGPAANSGPSVPGAADCTPPTPGAEILEVEYRLRVARAERERAPIPAPEYHGPNAQNAAANQAEWEKRKLCGACYACLNSRVNYDLFHLDCSQHGRRATPKQRADKALRVPGTIPGKAF
jgi:hypothetical protein